MAGYDDIPFAVEELFIKFVPITLDDGRKIDGEQTAEILMHAVEKHGSTWISISQAARGMSAKRAEHLNRAIREGQIIHLFIGVNNRNIDNDIGFSCRIREIRTSPSPVPGPDRSNLAEEFSYEGMCRTWVLVTDMKRETERKAEDYIISGTGGSLKWTIAHSRMSFAYIMERIG